MSKHTPRPWKAWHRGNLGPNFEPEIWIGIDHPEYGELSHITVRAGCDEAAEVGCMEANAAHIVKAVNLHDALVAALKSALDECSQDACKPLFWDNAIALLAKASDGEK